jgi:RNA polymerase sigma-70 factor (ECF subfamily)
VIRKLSSRFNHYLCIVLKEQSNISALEFESLFKNYYSELCGFANKYLQDIGAAEDIVQAFFVKYWENRTEINVKNSQRSYLFTSVKNACLNQLKHINIREDYKEFNQREMDDSQYTVSDEYEASELDVKIRKSIEELPEARKKIFIMSRYEGLKYKEIADKLNISIKTVENQMGSAIKHLKVDLAEYLLFIALLFTIY